MASPDLTQLLDRLNKGETGAEQELIPLVYQHLKHLARNIRRERGATPTLNTSALVHEAYLKLVNQDHYQSRLHFFRVAAKAMRQVVYSYAEQKMAQKRGGNQPHLSLEEIEVMLPAANWEELLSLEQALKALEAQSPRLGKVVECRFFGGLTIEETALALDISEPTVKRDWRLAQSWLYRYMHQ